MAKTTRQVFEEFETEGWAAANKWVWQNAPHGETPYQDAKIRYQVAVARIAELERELVAHRAIVRHWNAGPDRDQPCWCGAIEDHNHSALCSALRAAFLAAREAT